jgi:hypothetical protein
MQTRTCHFVACNVQVSRCNILCEKHWKERSDNFKHDWAYVRGHRHASQKVYANILRSFPPYIITDDHIKELAGESAKLAEKFRPEELPARRR